MILRIKLKCRCRKCGKINLIGDGLTRKCTDCGNEITARKPKYNLRAMKINIDKWYNREINEGNYL